MYWPAPNQQEVRLADTLVRRWNRTHPGIQVRMQPIPVSQSTEEVLLAAIAGKTTPDVCSNINPMAMREYTTSGGLVALDQFPDFDSIAATRTPYDQLTSFKSADNHYYQFPWKTNPVMMFVNRRMLKEAGVEKIPGTYEAFYAAGEKVSRDLNGDGQIDVWMGERDIRPIWWQREFDVYPFFIAASGGRTFFHDGEIAFDNQYAVQVFEFFQHCYSHKLFPRTFFQGGDPFILEKKATHFSGPWQIAQIQKFNPTMDYEVVPLPVPDSSIHPVYTFGDFKNIAIFSNTRYPRESWEFTKFLVDSRNDLLLLEYCNQLPVRGDLLTNPLFAGYFKGSEAMREFARQVPFTRGMDSVPDLKEIFDALSEQYEMCAVYGQRTPTEAVHAASERARAILEWNK